MSHEAIIERLKDAANRLSYYNAAEGDSWAAESQARSAAAAEFAGIRDECEKAGVDPKPHLTGYLI